MRRIIVVIGLLLLFACPVSAEEITAPQPPPEAADLIPVERRSFFEDLMTVVGEAAEIVAPDTTKAVRLCIGLLAVTLSVAMLDSISGKVMAAEVCAVVGIAALLIHSAGTMISLGAQTVRSLSDYGKLLLPVMTGALAAQGGTTASAALHMLTALFDSLLSSAATSVIVPVLYGFLALSIGGAAAGSPSLLKLADLAKWLATWFLKVVLYAFTGFMSITGVVSGSADAALVKAAKLSISGLVPVVGGILSDASESVIVGAAVVKNTAGIYGLLAVLAIWITPFLRIGIQYLLLKATAALAETFGVKRCSDLISRFAAAMGLLLAMTAAVCFMLLISTICFMKGGV